MFKKGDIVTMSEIGMKEHGPSMFNPHNAKGVILNSNPFFGINDPAYCIKVRWDNGRENLYRVKDLDHYNTIEYYFFSDPNIKVSINEISFICFKILNEKECILLTSNPEQGFSKIERLYYEKIEKNN